MVLTGTTHTAIKHRVPRLATPWIRRERLLRRLDGGSHVVVSGPPGAGKTGLVSEWMRRRHGGAGVWLSLDPSDNEPGRLEALVARVLGADGGPFSGGRFSGPDHLEALLGAIAEAGVAVTMVLDDVQELTDRRALDTLEHLLAWAPGCLSVVLASRVDPPIGLPRLRMEGRMREIRASDLAFTRDETADFFAASGIDLTRSCSDTLWSRIEGWVAGVRLAATALASETDPARFVADATRTEAVVSSYLVSEVFDQQPPAVREFLLQTSVADLLTGDLACELSGRDDASRQLEALERRGVFLTALDDLGQSYRYHPLFGALLRARFRVERPDDAAALARRAAAWYSGHEMPADAEAHARRAGDWTMVGALRRDEWLRSVEVGGLDRPPVLLDLPAGVTGTVPALAVLVYAEAICHIDRDAADRARDQIRGSEEFQCAPSLALVDAMAGRAFGASPLGLDAGRRLRAATDTSAVESIVASLCEAAMRLQTGDVARAVDLLEQTHQAADACHFVWAADEARAWLALVAAARGCLGDATDMLAGWPGAQDHDAAVLTECLCDAARGRTARALARLQAHDLPHAVPCVVRAVHALVLDVLQPRIPTRSGPVHGDFLLDILTVLGDVERVIESIDESAIERPGEHALARVREVVNNGHDDALTYDTAIAAVDEIAVSHVRTEVELLLIAAHSADRLAAEDRAFQLVERALDRAVRDDVRAPFIDHGAATESLFSRYGWQLGRLHAFAVEVLDDVRRTEPPVFVEPLTDREQDVLRCLPSMMSNLEIARELYVSVNTVKTHLKSMYRKLGVERRRDAVVRARQLEIL